MSNVSDLVGKPLSEFRLVEMTEVYRTNEDGGYTHTEGCFADGGLARAYASGLTDSNYTSFRNILVLTDGKVGYHCLGTEVLLVDVEGALELVRKRAISKLTPGELQALGVRA